MIGSTFAFYSSRDNKGNYVPNPERPGDTSGLVSKKFEGIVESVSYLYEESGNCSKNWYGAMYVEIKLKPTITQEEVPGL